MQESGRAYFVKRPRRAEDLFEEHRPERERTYHVVKTIRLSQGDFTNFAADLLADRSFLQEDAAMCKQGETWECLLIQGRGKKRGILVIPERDCFVGWAASAT